jgi:ArsR family transcriptional regulator, lead/cadmium/zinc/bismuth-responsive transcriptional repressor
MLATTRDALMPGAEVESIADLFRMLGDGTRVRILDTLAQGEQCVSDIAELVGMSESAVSHQLRLLRATRLVRVRRTGRQAFYALDDHHIIGLLHDARRHVQEQA